MANVIGPDVSFYQDDPETPQGINFVKMRAPAGYVIIRAGQNLWPDADFKSNWRAAKKAGLPRGSYWFYDSRADPKRQAELWVSLFEGDFGELPLFADFEETYKGPYAGWKKWYDFLERLKQLMHGKEIAIYTGFYYWRENAPNSTLQNANLEYFHQFPLWIANYGVAEPSIPKPWGKNEWMFWQFTDGGDGNLYGVESNGIDLNYFNGDMAAFRARFNLSDMPPPNPDDPPADDTDPADTSGQKYKVTTTALRVREGPGTNFPSMGNVYFGEVVEALQATNDHSWIKIRNRDGSLIGWSSGAYLIRTTATTPSPDPGDPPPPPVPGDEANKWYRVNATTLFVRESPSISGKKLGFLSKDDTVPAVDDSSNPEWTQIRRLDGLTGWCNNPYLSLIGTTRPDSIRQKLFTGITYLRKEISEPRKNVIHVLAIDLATVGYEFLVTPTNNADGILCTRTTSKFLDEFKLHVAINGDGFNYLDSSINPSISCPDGGDPVKPNGLAASRGNIYSPVKSAQPTVYISQKNQISVGPKGRIFNAVSGDRIVVEKGQIANNLATNVPNPRTAIGLNQNGRWLIFMVVDGRETDYSLGVTLPELANLLISYDVYSGINMDGGGSSTLVIKGVDGKARVLNSPVDQNIAGKERAVANHLGLFVKM